MGEESAREEKRARARARTRVCSYASLCVYRQARIMLEYSHVCARHTKRNVLNRPAAAFRSGASSAPSSARRGGQNCNSAGPSSDIIATSGCVCMPVYV